MLYWETVLWLKLLVLRLERLSKYREMSRFRLVLRVRLRV
jgi:hypothetical protein